MVANEDSSGNVLHIDAEIIPGSIVTEGEKVPVPVLISKVPRTEGSIDADDASRIVMEWICECTRKGRFDKRTWQNNPELFFDGRYVRECHG
jgi:hypothetical protein